MQAQENGEKSCEVLFPARQRTSGWTEYTDQRVFLALPADWAKMSIDYERMRDFGTEAAIQYAIKVWYCSFFVHVRVTWLSYTILRASACIKSWVSRTVSHMRAHDALHAYSCKFSMRLFVLCRGISNFLAN